MLIFLSPIQLIIPCAIESIWSWLQVNKIMKLIFAKYVPESCHIMVGMSLLRHQPCISVQVPFAMLGITEIGIQIRTK